VLLLDVDWVVMVFDGLVDWGGVGCWVVGVVDCFGRSMGGGLGLIGRGGWGVGVFVLFFALWLIIRLIWLYGCCGFV